VTGDNLPGQNPEYNYLAPVEGRVAHIDADFMAYIAAANRKDELDGIAPMRSLAQKKEQVISLLKMHMKQVGATDYVAHITPPGSDKGGREALAVTKPYQANRKDKAKPADLDAIRHFIGEKLNSIVHLDQEADDGMTQANYAACRAGTPELSVIVSKDKDLRMAPGLLWDFDTETIVDNSEDTFGHIWIDRSASAAKLLGWGTKFFWAQCLMGDAADNIAGLPKYTREKDGKSMNCGAVTTEKLLADCKTDIDCFNLIKKLWSESQHEWIDYRTQEPTTWNKALVGDMELLWMRRVKGESVLDWLGEVNEKAKEQSTTSST
jgi:DNA polymerase-1